MNSEDFPENLENLPSSELIKRWRLGSQDAARVLTARYEVRLVALVASRLNRKFRPSIDPTDVVQSAIGSFFRVTAKTDQEPIQNESSFSAWNLLATFVRRKLSGALRRETAQKRGGNWSRASLELIADTQGAGESFESQAMDLIADLQSALEPDQMQLIELLVQNATQKEIAEKLGVNERTVRNRIAQLRSRLIDHDCTRESEKHKQEFVPITIGLPTISYREFVLGKLVGRGAFSKVYRACFQSDNRVVAVKFMHRDLWADPQSQESFLREIDHASRINHAGILKYFGWGQSPHGGPYLVCEFLEGHSLKDATAYSASLRLGWLRQICEAIRAAHDSGVVHGDLSPNNIMIETSGRVVITDFGLASYMRKSLSEVGMNSHAEVVANVPGGTLGFAAPEQISPAFGRVGPSTDIYGIGGIAYYLLTGRSPICDRSILQSISEADIDIPSLEQTFATSKLAEIAKIALKKAVNSRPQSISNLIATISDNS